MDLSRWSLQGMTALVTCGSKGIGYAIVEELAGFGARVHICDRDQTLLNECLSKWQATRFEVNGSVCDVTSGSQREELMRTVSSVFGGKLYILKDFLYCSYGLNEINNVGKYMLKPTLESTAEDFSS